MQAMMSRISNVFSPYWDLYTPYQTLQTKTERLRELLNSKPSSNYRDDGSPVPVLVGNAKPLDECVETYKVNHFDLSGFLNFKCQTRFVLNVLVDIRSSTFYSYFIEIHEKKTMRCC